MSHQCEMPAADHDVEVLVLGVWLDGELLGHDYAGAEKVAHVKWSAGVGHERNGWYDPTQVRFPAQRTG